MVTVIQN